MSEPYEYEEEARYEAFLDELKRDKAFIEDAFDFVSQENVQAYLGKYGDAIEGRINHCITQAEQLYKSGFFGPSLTLSATAIEIIIRFMLLRPLVQGAFLSDEWAAILSKRTATGRTAEDRELLPTILNKWGIDITSVKLTDGKGLWEIFLSSIRPKRDGFVHKGDPVSEREAKLGLECADTFLKNVVYRLADILGFTISVTSKWCEIRKKYPYRIDEKSFTPENPF